MNNTQTPNEPTPFRAINVKSIEENPMSDCLRLKDAAKEFSIKENTLRKWRKESEKNPLMYPTFVKTGGIVWVLRSSMHAFINREKNRVYAAASGE